MYLQSFYQDLNPTYGLGFGLIEKKSQENHWTQNVTLCQSGEDRHPRFPAPLTAEPRVLALGVLENAQTTL